VARGARPYVLARLRQGEGVAQIIRFLEQEGGLKLAAIPD
jgi:urease accessory protein